MAYRSSLTTEAAFSRYEEVRGRFPGAQFPKHSIPCGGLLEIAERFDAVLLDSFGVLNVGDRPIPGARACVAELRALGKRLIVLTNAASYTRTEALETYHGLGFDFTAQEVVSSRDVATARLETVAPGARWGAIAAPEDRFADIDADVRHWTGADVDAFLLLSSAALTPGLFAALQAALKARPRPVVVANPDLVAPRESGLSKEPGYYGHLLADRLDLDLNFFGKPFGPAFDDALGRIADVPADRVIMVGDTLHTDILGGRACGLKTVLVRDHGLFAGMDVARYIARSGIVPDFQCPAI